MSKLAITLATLCLLAGPSVADPVPAKAAPAAVETAAPARHAASSAELDQYAQREQAAKKLETFEGGRGRGAETGTIIIVLLVVIIILIIL